MNFIFVALGGAVGAMARYAISLIPLKTEFPFLTLITNVIGAILIGFIAGITSGRDGVSRNMVLFWKTGVCGGFTTFSTFSLESYNLFEHDHCLLGCGYVLLSCLGYINMLVSSSSAQMHPFLVATDSNVLQLVVPTDITLPPFFLVSLIKSAVSCGII